MYEFTKNYAQAKLACVNMIQQRLNDLEKDEPFSSLKSELSTILTKLQNEICTKEEFVQLIYENYLSIDKAEADLYNAAYAGTARKMIDYALSVYAINKDKISEEISNSIYIGLFFNEGSDQENKAKERILKKIINNINNYKENSDKEDTQEELKDKLCLFGGL